MSIESEDIIPNGKSTEILTALPDVWKPGMPVTYGEGAAARKYGELICTHPDEKDRVLVLVQVNERLQKAENWPVENTYAQK